MSASKKPALQATFRASPDKTTSRPTSAPTSAPTSRLTSKSAGGTAADAGRGSGFKDASGITALEREFTASPNVRPSNVRPPNARPPNVRPSARSSVQASKPAVENSPPQANDRLETLLTLERDIRKAKKLKELKYLLPNEAMKLVPADLVLFHRPTRKGKLKEIELISSLATLDANAPLLVWLNKEISKSLEVKASAAKANMEKNKAAPPPEDAEGHVRIHLNCQGAPGVVFPFPYALHVPHYSNQGKLLGATTYLRQTPFDDGDTAFAGRLGETAAHAIQALSPRRGTWSYLFSKPVAIVCTIAVVLAMFIPVTLTVLAPVEIVPHKPASVASPLSGVVQSIAVLPNALVKEGQPLFSLNTVELASKFEVAARNVAIAEARYRRAMQGAFRSLESKRELAVTKAEYEMAVTERDYASARLKQAEVTAPRPGIILFSGQEKWTGKPVVTGERIMRIADPTQIRMRIELETRDAIILDNGASVNAFFDSDPLTPVSGTLETQSYQAETTDANVLVFPITAAIDDKQQIKHRIGLRGTAQIYGSKVPLWFFLFRKPISAIRQMIGI